MVSATQTLRVSMGVRVHPSVSSLAVKKPLSLNFVKLRHTCETCRPDVSDKDTAASTAIRAVACPVLCRVIVPRREGDLLFDLASGPIVRLESRHFSGLSTGDSAAR